MVLTVLSVMFVGSELLFVSIGCDTCVKREMTVNSCMNMTCLKCLYVISSKNLVNAIIKIVNTCMSMLNL